MMKSENSKFAQISYSRICSEVFQRSYIIRPENFPRLRERDIRVHNLKPRSAVTLRRHKAKTSFVYQCDNVDVKYLSASNDLNST